MSIRIVSFFGLDFGIIVLLFLFFTDQYSLLADVTYLHFFNLKFYIFNQDLNILLREIVFAI